MAWGQEESEYRLAAVLPKPYPWGVGADHWAEFITQRTQGRIKVRGFNNATLTGGDSTKEFAALRQGTIDLAVCAAQNWTGQVKELNHFSLPFLLLDFRAVDALLKSPVSKLLFERISAKGVVPLAWGENGFRELTNSRHPIRTPSDLKGLKIRTAASATMIDTLRALGANPTQMSWADLQPALATGAADGQENPLQVIKYSKMSTPGQKHLSLAAVALAAEQFGRIDILANIAGAYIRLTGPAHLGREQDWDLVSDSNLKGISLMSSAVIPHMLTRGAGRIIKFSSNAGRTSSPVLGASYTAAKAGVLGLSRHLAKEYAANNILVNSIAPGPAKGERGADLFSAEIEAALLADIPLGRLADPQEAANLVLFLASDLASYITGATIDVNGGYVMV